MKHRIRKKQFWKLIQMTGLLALGTQVLQAMPNAPSGKKWVKVDALSDEFEGGSLNSSKWQPTHPYWVGRPPSRFKASNVSLGGGKLRLKSTSRINRISEAGSNPNVGHWVDAACVTSKARSFEVGMYSEARMKMSRLSMTSSFWMQGRYSEIDVIENIGAPSNPRWSRIAQLMEMNTHYFANGWPNDLATPKHYNMGVNNADAFHTYGVHWINNRTLQMYLDGRPVQKITTRGDFNEKQLIFLDTETFTWGVGLPTIASLKDNSKNTALVEYVRTYRLANGSSNPPAPAPRPDPEPPVTQNPPSNGGSGTIKVGDLIALKGNNGRYISSEGGFREATCNRVSVGSNERFRVVDGGNGMIALRGSGDRYLSSEYGRNPIKVNRTAIGAWERFSVQSAGNGKVALKSSNGKFISSENGTKSITCNRDAVGSWEAFSVEKQ